MGTLGRVLEWLGWGLGGSWGFVCESQTVRKRVHRTCGTTERFVVDEGIQRWTGGLNIVSLGSNGMP